MKILLRSWELLVIYKTSIYHLYLHLGFSLNCKIILSQSNVFINIIIFGVCRLFIVSYLSALGFSGTVVVPTLYDKKLKRVVSNESADIVRMMNSEFSEFCETPEQKELDLYPEPLRKQIEEVEAWIQK